MTKPLWQILRMDKTLDINNRVAYSVTIIKVNFRVKKYLGSKDTNIKGHWKVALQTLKI